MKPVPPERHRVTAEVCARLGWAPGVASTAADGMAGMFLIPNPLSSLGRRRMGRGFEGLIRCVVHDGQGAGGWEHVSASFDHRCPTWEEMCLVKDAFWCEDEVAVQFHPAKADYVNRHPFTLHLWRHPSIATPPPHLV